MHSFLHIRKIMLVNLLLFSFSLFSQKDTTQYFNKTLNNNNFSIELGGKGYLYSVGYERTILKRKTFLLSVNINISFEPFIGYDGIIIPIGLNTLFGKNKNKLLVGLNATNGFDPTPYPKTRKERKEYQTTGQYRYDRYEAPYRILFVVPYVGYRKYFKNNNSLSVAFTYLIYVDSIGTYHFFEPGLVPWLGINYNIKF